MLKQMQQGLKHRHAIGAGLVEVLVALVVIGVGMLGIASLYVVTLQAKTASQSRMQAVNLAADMAERIRANPTAAAGYGIAESDGIPTATTICFQTTSTAAAQCNPGQLATADLAQWCTLVSNTLPGSPKRSIVYTAASATTPAMYSIQLRWSEPSSSINLSYLLEVRI